MKTCVTLALLSVGTLALGASVAVAQPVADAGIDRTVAADYHAGQYVQLKGQRSRPTTGLSYSWSVVSGGPVEWATPTTDMNPVGFFPLGTTTVQLTVKKGKQTSSDTVTITVLDQRYRSHVVSYRPWAHDLPQMSVDILAGIETILAKDPANPDLKIARDAAQTAAYYETVCYDVQFIDSVSGQTYNEITTQYYLVARAYQIQHHEGVAVHYYLGTGDTGSAEQQALMRKVIDAGKYDLEQGLARTDAPVEPAPYPTTPSL
ncbi:MAG TPA: PKD domain-containing protein [Pirellulaceae bacterium]|jgi:PKD repeat protein|nr:PKD domain-containing protein [Pirellulaceae bacterium]